MLLVCISQNVVISIGDIDTNLRRCYGVNKLYPNITNYFSIPIIGSLCLVSINLFDENSLILQKYTGNDIEKFNEIIREFDKFSYDSNQSDPTVLQRTQYGNCQAYAIYFFLLCKRNNVNVKYITNPSHISCAVFLMEKWYNVDLVKKKIEEDI